MKIKFGLLAILLLLAFCLPPLTVWGQTPATPTPTAPPPPEDEPTLNSTPTPAPAGNPVDSLVFSQLGMERDINLQGPHDSTSLLFTLPPGWQPAGNATLALDLTATFSSLVVAQDENSPVGVAGVLTPWLNGVALGGQVLTSGGTTRLWFDLPEGALSGGPGPYTLDIEWDASVSCAANLATLLALHPSSYLAVPHLQAPLEPRLADFPAPFWQPNVPSAAAIALIVPDVPAAVELQAVYTLAAGLARLSEGQAKLKLLPVSALDSALRSADFIILVGKNTSLEGLPFAAQLGLPAMPEPGLGWVRVQVSPWNQGSAVLLVGGPDEASLLAAARSAAGANLIANGENETAWISARQAAPVSSSPAAAVVELTSAGQPLVFKLAGSHTEKISFQLSALQAGSSEAYLDLGLSHSEMLDYLRSGLTLRLNGQPLSSVRLSDATAQPNRLRLPVPAALLRPGKNSIEIQVEIYARSICSDPRLGSLWLALLPESRLQFSSGLLPGQTPNSSHQALALAADTRGLAAFPQSFSGGSLDDSLLLLSGNDKDFWNWSLALDLVTWLALQSASGSPQVAFGNTLAENQLQVGTIIAFASPAFEGWELSQSDGLTINDLLTPDGTLRIPAGVGSFPALDLAGGTSAAGMGWLVAGQKENSRVFGLYAASAEGLKTALQALERSATEAAQEVNFGVVQGDRVLYTQLMAAPAALSPGATLAPGAQAPSAQAINAPQVWMVSQRLWLLPVLLVSLGLLGFLVFLEIAAWRRTRR